MLQVKINKRFTNEEHTSFILDLSFTAPDGITILFGPSGSGKTTTLRALAGMITPDGGKIRVGGRVYFDSTAGINLSIQHRRVGYVFQDYALFPHLTAEQNIAYGVKADKARMRRERAREMLTLFQLEGMRSRYPHELSGGERQRIALARALASDPAVVLLDEPLSAVDVATRAKLLEEIESVQQKTSVPFLYVTHNHKEAERIGTYIVILDEGRLVQEGKPSELFGKLLEN
ncbi:MAG: ATP-binding cassette domain-containing protein [Pyrinomonadaceae bacterium]|nr:ATP-binding cassette domain-containing protein [Pyrinomonadaceae bacterium]